MRPPETGEPPRRSTVEELAADASSRKRFLRAAGGTVAAGALAAAISACGKAKPPTLTPGGSNPNTGAGAGTDQYGPGDRGIARYAVTLEYIEADLYAKAVAGGALKGKAADLARRFADQENAHIKALEAQIHKLGGRPPTRPRGQYPVASQQTFLDFALGVESLGAGALLGQLDRIESKELLATALSIHSVEGRHAAALASLLGKNPAPEGPFARAANAADVLNQLHRITAGNAA